MTEIFKKVNQVEIFHAYNQNASVLLGTPMVYPVHEIAPFKTNNMPLRLSTIHVHWKKLSLVAPDKDTFTAETMKTWIYCSIGFGGKQGVAVIFDQKVQRFCSS